MIGTIGNGKRLNVAFGSYTGIAGIVQRDAATQVAFRGRTREVAPGIEGTIDGRRFRVISVCSSAHLSGMVVLDVQPV